MGDDRPGVPRPIPNVLRRGFVRTTCVAAALMLASACASSPGPSAAEGAPVHLPDVPLDEVIRIDLGTAPPEPTRAAGGMTARIRPLPGERLESADPSRVRVEGDGSRLVGVRWGLAPVRVLSSEEPYSVWVLVRPSGGFRYEGALGYSVVGAMPPRAMRTEEPNTSVAGEVTFSDVPEGVMVTLRGCRAVIPIEDLHGGGQTACGIIVSGDQLNLRTERSGLLRYEYPVRTDRCIRTNDEGACIQWDVAMREGARRVVMRGVVPVYR